MKIDYAGTDITGGVSVHQCIHDMYAAERSDTLCLTLNDTANLWDGWVPAPGEEIRVEYGTAGTGAMFLSSMTAENGLYTLRAQSAPPRGMEAAGRAWAQVKLLQLGAEIAGRNGLAFESYGVEDRLYPYLMQSGESDFSFLHRRCVLEGCAFLIYDKKLVLYSEPYMESAEPAGTITVGADGTYRYFDRRSQWYGSCLLESGAYTGTYDAKNGVSRVLKPPPPGNIGGKEEADRFAKNLLRDANKLGQWGYVQCASILEGYAAGSVAELSNPRAATWDGPVFLHHIRNDYGQGKSKLFFRRPLGD